MNRAFRFLAAAAALVAAPLLGQDRRVDIDPVNLTPVARQVGMEQLNRSLAADRLAAARATGPLPIRDATPFNPQVNPNQSRTEPTANLSARADSRGTITPVVGGTDRCDPARPGGGGAVCKQVLETRSGEFAVRPPALSAETALLAATRPGAAFDAQTSRDSGGNGDAELRSNQEVASIVLNQQQQQVAQGQQQTLDASQQEIISAVIQSIGGGN